MFLIYPLYGLLTALCDNAIVSLCTKNLISVPAVLSYLVFVYYIHPKSMLSNTNKIAIHVCNLRV